MTSWQESAVGKGRHAYIDLTGQRFGRLQVVSRSVERKGKCISWLCQCDCGNGTIVSGNMLKRKTQSCGCARDGSSTLTHGMTHTPEFNTWNHIKQRCYNPKNQAYRNYGGRGISVSDEWRNSFDKFFADMGPKPSAKHTIERLDNNGGYSASNCAWRSRSDQSSNKRSSKLWIIHGVTYTTRAEAGLALGMCKQLISRRCVGYYLKGKRFLPVEGYSCVLKYGNQTVSLTLKDDIADRRWAA